MPNITFLSFSSLYWISGFVTLVSATLNGSVRIITTEKFSPGLILSLIEKYKINQVYTPPSSLAETLKHCRLCKTDLTSLQYWWCGGSYVHTELIDKMNEYLPNGAVYTGYGVTEMTGVVAMDLSRRKGNTVGQLRAGVSMKIVDDYGNRVGVGVDGEICFYSKCRFLGYYGNEEQTRAMYDNEGFVKSGDIGHFDEDGDLFLVDRKKDIFKYKCQQISPSEIENVILKHEGVKMVSVVDIPDSEYNDLPAAAVVKSDWSNITSSEIYDIVKCKLNDAKQLRGGIYFVDSLPMTPSGKVMRRKVKEIIMKLCSTN